jgi:hypothetical protein
MIKNGKYTSRDLRNGQRWRCKKCGGTVMTDASGEKRYEHIETEKEMARRKELERWKESLR